MSKAEEKALEVYPPRLVGDPTFPYGQWDVHGLERRCYQEGYEQAEKDILDDAKQVVASFEQAFKQAEKNLGWHPATEYPPEDEEVIVLTVPHGIKNFYEIQVSHILKETKLWAIRDKVVWWMPMPKIPKEDE